MFENGAKTVKPWGLDWKPPHGCSIAWSVGRTEGFGCFIDYMVSWTKPPVKGLQRIETFKVSARVTTNDERTYAALDRYCEEQIDRIVHADSVRLLARGKRTQTADADRFKGEILCPV